MKHTAIIGECMIELNGTAFGEMHQTFGGDTLNTAVYLSRCAGDAVSVRYVTALGTDALSRGMKERWEKEGIVTDCVLTDATRHAGLYLIQLNENGERTFLYWRNESAASRMLSLPDFNQVEKRLEQCDLIYLSGISLAILPDADRTRLLDMLEQMAKKGISIAFDGNYRPKLWQSKDETRHVYERILRFSSLALMTDEDEFALWDETATEEIFARLQRFGIKTAVVKSGENGCFCRDFENGSPSVERIAAVPIKHPVDTTSAGDAFNAGFLAGYLQGKPVETCALQGNRLASVVIMHKGAVVPRQATDSIISAFK